MRPIWIVFFDVFCGIIEVNIFFIVLLYSVSSFLCIMYAYVSVDSTEHFYKAFNAILLPSLLISSVDTLCLSFLDVCCDFDVICCLLRFFCENHKEFLKDTRLY